MPCPKPPYLLSSAQMHRLSPHVPLPQGIPHDAMLYRQRHRIEIMFGRLKDWRRIAMRYDRCAHTFFSAITLAASVIFWLGQ